MGFNNEDYINGQISKQYKQTVESTYKVSFEYEPFDLDDELVEEVICSDLSALQEAVKGKRMTYEDISKSFWNRIVKKKEYNAVISLNTQIFEQARTMEYNENNDILYGLPILVKDNIEVKGLPTTAGAAVLKEYEPDSDAEIINRLKEKGALIIGKTNLSEWANFMSTDSSNGYSTIGGQTKNAYGSFDVGGSSSGSAVAVALNLAPIAIGTETAGSIIYPASQNGVVGLKPTLETVSQQGIIPISKSHDTAGPMAHTVKDTYHLFKGISEINTEVVWDKNILNGLEMGILENDAVKNTYRADDHKIMESLSKVLSHKGADVTSVKASDSAFEADYYSILKHEFNEGITDFFNNKSEIPLTLNEIIAFNELDGDNTAPYNQELLKESAVTHSTNEENASVIASNRKIASDALEALFERVDVLVTISNYATVLYAESGNPAVTLPGYKRLTGEPVGITLIEKHGQDVRLLEIAYGLEQALLVVK